MALLGKGGFELRKWASNSNSLVKDIEHYQSENMVLQMDPDDTIKTLGLPWNAHQDIFKLLIPEISSSRRVTKRAILSDTAQIFDRLGLINPVIVTTKVLLHRLWSLRLDWDESIPVDIHTVWFRHRAQLQKLSALKIPRKIVPKQPVEKQLHRFSDASESAYGACIYLRTVDADDNVRVNLECSKSRVARLKSISLPRLELCGALLLARFTSKVKMALKLDDVGTKYWSASTIVLSWINSPSRNFNSFVSNRVSEIQVLSKAKEWNYVNTTGNAADILSRGCSPEQILLASQWWYGSAWLKEDSSLWPQRCSSLSEEETPERRKILVHIAVAFVPVIVWDTYSSYTKLIRVTASILRFIKSCKQRKNRFGGPLTALELQAAKRSIVKQVQREVFDVELRQLKEAKTIDSNSKLLCLNPILDENGIIRVGGRIGKSAASYDIKHPMVIPSRYQLTELIIRHQHLKQLHAGAEGTLAAVRSKYWPLASRSAVRNLVRKCGKCFRVKPRPTQCLMGELPKNRLESTRPFLNCGAIIAGRFTIVTISSERLR